MTGVKSIYISGPYTMGDRTLNIRNVMDTANTLLEKGWYPFIPHLTFFQDLVHLRPLESWMEYDLYWLHKCDAIIRLPGVSKGADIELAEAFKRSIKRYYNLSEVPNLKEVKHG